MSTPAAGRILVTGGAGFIGSHLVDRLLRDGTEILVLDDLSSGRTRPPAAVELVEVDVAAAEATRLVVDWQPDTIVHCAAQVSVTASFRDPARDALTNVVGTIRLAEGARRAGTSRFVYVTTGGALYGRTPRIPSREDDPIEPASPYGLSKWAAERYVTALPASTRAIVLRLANVYGPRQDARGEAGVVSIFVDRMLRDEEVVIDGDGRQTRDFVYVADVVDAIARACEADRPAVVNVGTGEGTAILELFGRLAAVLGYRREPRHGPARQGDVRDSVLHVGRAREELGWTPSITLDDGLRLTADWFRAPVA